MLSNKKYEEVARYDKEEEGVKLLSVKDVADYLGVPVRTIYGWRSTGRGPRGYRIGKYVRYKPEDVEAWVEAQHETLKEAV